MHHTKSGMNRCSKWHTAPKQEMLRKVTDSVSKERMRIHAMGQPCEGVLRTLVGSAGVHHNFGLTLAASCTAARNSSPGGVSSLAPSCPSVQAYTTCTAGRQHRQVSRTAQDACRCWEGTQHAFHAPTGTLALQQGSCSKQVICRKPGFQHQTLACKMPARPCRQAATISEAVGACACQEQLSEEIPMGTPSTAAKVGLHKPQQIAGPAASPSALCTAPAPQPARMQCTSAVQQLLGTWRLIDGIRSPVA